MLKTLPSEKEYRAHDAVNFTSLKQLSQGPAAYRYFRDVGNAEGTTTDRIFRSAVHSRILTPELYAQEYVVYDGDRRTKLYKEFAAANAGKRILSGSEGEKVERYAEAALKHEFLSSLLAHTYTETEKAFVYTDPATGLQCKALIDIYNPILRIIADLKSFRFVPHHKAAWVIRDGYWDVQGVHYTIPGAMAAGCEQDEMSFANIIIMDSGEKGIETAWVWHGAGLVERARNLREGWLRTVQTCTASGVWPQAYPGSEFVAEIETE